MSTMSVKIYTIDSIEEKEVAQKFLGILEEHQIAPQKIGSYEPLKTDYTFEQAIQIWTEEEDGCYVDGIGMTGKAGGLMGKIKDPRIIFNMNWWRCPNKVYANNIDFHFPIKTFRNYQENIENTFKETIKLVNAIYGYITIDKVLERQHVTGTIETRLPGVFWCNYFGEKYIEFFSEEKIVSFPWYKIEKLDGGIISYLANVPDKELLKSDNLEIQAKVHLGIDSFGDLVEYQTNPENIQIKNVPKI